MYGGTACDTAQQVIYAPDELGERCNEKTLALVLRLTWTVDLGETKQQRKCVVTWVRRLPAELEYPHAVWSFGELEVDLKLL